MTTKHWTASVRVGTPNPPEPRLYAHLPEKERMIQGWPNDPMDPQLLSERVHAQKMCARYNETKSDELKERQDILDVQIHLRLINSSQSQSQNYYFDHQHVIILLQSYFKGTSSSIVQRKEKTHQNSFLCRLRRQVQSGR